MHRKNGSVRGFLYFLTSIILMRSKFYIFKQEAKIISMAFFGSIYFCKRMLKITDHIHFAQAHTHNNLPRAFADTTIQFVAEGVVKCFF